jgi:ATP-dependent Clp protease ATP-binding subunit ClpX
MDNVDIRFTDDALEAAADQAIKRKTGARGLRSILEHTLLEVMYEIPSMADVVSCVVDANAINGKSSVTLVMKNGTVIPMQLIEKKSA